MKKLVIGRFTFSFLLILALQLFLTSHAVCQGYEAGRKAANTGDFRKAMAIWRPLAESGNADAQFALGRMYARGDGTRVDFVEARKWFLKAARNGNREACEKLSLMYGSGDGVQRNSAFAKLWDDASRGVISVEEVEAQINPPQKVALAPTAAPATTTEPETLTQPEIKQPEISTPAAIPTRKPGWQSTLDELVAVPPTPDAEILKKTEPAETPSPVKQGTSGGGSENQIDLQMKKISEASLKVAEKEKDTWLARGVSFDDLKRCLAVDLNKEIVSGYVPPATAIERWQDTIEERLKAGMKTSQAGKLPLGCERYFGEAQFEDPALFRKAVEQKMRETM